MFQSCVIKVSDLLRNVTRSDEIIIKDCMIQGINNLRSPGISAICHLQSTNDGTIVVTLSNIVAAIDDICDLSGDLYIRDVSISSYQGRFSPDIVFHNDPDYVYEEDFPFLMDSESIDLKDMLLQAILLQEPLIHIKPGNEYLQEDFDSADLTSRGTISFRKAN